MMMIEPPARAAAMQFEEALDQLEILLAIAKSRLRRAMAGPIELQGDYTAIRADYRETVYGAVLEYLISGASSTAFRNEIKRAVVDRFPDAFYAGYRAGSEDVDADDDAWLTAKINSELGYIDLLFQALKTVKDEQLPPRELVAEAERRADGYAGTLDGLFAEGRLRGEGRKMLTLTGDDGEESCRDCQRLKGQRHRASWWASHGLIPGQPGNPNYQCHGYRCEHFLVDDDGVRWQP